MPEITTIMQTGAAAAALKKAQEKLSQRQLSLVVWDCYRPARAFATS